MYICNIVGFCMCVCVCVCLSITLRRLVVVGWHNLPTKWGGGVARCPSKESLFCTGLNLFTFRFNNVQRCSLWLNGNLFKRHRRNDSFSSGQTYYQGNRIVLKNSWAPPREKIYLTHNFGNIFLNEVNYCLQLSLLGVLSLHFYHLYHGTQ